MFLSRIEKSKGIYEAIGAFVILKKQYPELNLTIAGSGKELSNIKKYIKNIKIDNITLTGFIDGNQKTDVFTSADMYLFPSYNEGMPSSLAEAMAFGLPVVTRNVGGVSDFFVNEKHGYITDSKDPLILASLVELLIMNRDLARIMAINNFNFAKDRFYSDKVVNRIETIMCNVLNA